MTRPPAREPQDRRGAFWVTALLGLGLASAATGLAAGVYDAVDERDGVAVFDQPALREAIAWRTPGRDAVVGVLTGLGGSLWLPLIAAAVVALMCLAWRTWTPAVLMLVATAGSLTMTTVGKWVIGRARPEHRYAVPPFESSPSFPSGHTLNTTVVVAIVVYLLLRHQHTAVARCLTVLCGVLWALTIGLTRVFLGHHWLTDVMAGWMLGTAWAAVVITAHRVFFVDPRVRPGPATPSAPDRVSGGRAGR